MKTCCITICFGAVWFILGCENNNPVNYQCSEQDGYIAQNENEADYGTVSKDDYVFMLFCQKTDVSVGEDVDIAEIMHHPKDCIAEDYWHSIAETTYKKKGVSKEWGKIVLGDIYPSTQECWNSCGDIGKDALVMSGLSIRWNTVHFDAPGTYILKSLWEVEDKKNKSIRKVIACTVIWVKEAKEKNIPKNRKQTGSREFREQGSSREF